MKLLSERGLRPPFIKKTDIFVLYPVTFRKLIFGVVCYMIKNSVFITIPEKNKKRDYKEWI